MSCKVEGSRGAVGYWGRDINKRIEQEQTPEKVRALLQDKIESRGKDVLLWTQPTESTPNSLICSCVKDTTERPDVTCDSCYGVGIIPGYIKFSHETLFVSSISQGLTLIDIEKDLGIKPHRLLLEELATTGTIVSSRLQYSNPLSLDWDYKVDSPNIVETNTVSVSFSLDGINYYPLTEINDNGKKPIGIGGIYLKVMLTRVSVEDRSPEFEMIRIRHPMRIDPYIKILRPQVTELHTLMQYGRRTENMAERFWTMPLDYFDPTIPPNTPMARILENSFYERIIGVNAGNKYVTLKLSYNEELGIFTQQSFETRRIQPEEVYSTLVF
ncbi:hypothetical protein KAR91_86540 [Candidatus Pacearchaeota archaeon]|nr:hypothetical protein [Candidatus Pacearchaeota archaeon]